MFHIINCMHKQFDWSPLLVVRYNGRKKYWTSFYMCLYVWIELSHSIRSLRSVDQRLSIIIFLVAFYFVTHSVTVLPSHITSAVRFTNPRCFILFLRNKTVPDTAVCSVQVRRLWRHLPLQPYNTSGMLEKIKLVFEPTAFVLYFTNMHLQH